MDEELEDAPGELEQVEPGPQEPRASSVRELVETSPSNLRASGDSRPAGRVHAATKCRRGDPMALKPRSSGRSPPQPTSVVIQQLRPAARPRTAAERSRQVATGRCGARFEARGSLVPRKAERGSTPMLCTKKDFGQKTFSKWVILDPPSTVASIYT